MLHQVLEPFEADPEQRIECAKDTVLQDKRVQNIIKNVKYTEVKFVEAHFSSREAQCSWKRCMVPFLVQHIMQNS